MPAEHRASITWSQALSDRGLPTATEMIDPAWIDPDVPGEQEGWSLVCRFATPPKEQGNPSSATVRFAMEDAPDARLRPGTTLRLYERDSNQYAAVSILD